MESYLCGELMPSLDSGDYEFVTSSPSLVAIEIRALSNDDAIIVDTDAGRVANELAQLVDPYRTTTFQG